MVPQLPKVDVMSRFEHAGFIGIPIHHGKFNRRVFNPADQGPAGLDGGGGDVRHVRGLLFVLRDNRDGPSGDRFVAARIDRCANLDHQVLKHG
jgi:hypothetical protein